MNRTKAGIFAGAALLLIFGLFLLPAAAQQEDWTSVVENIGMKGKVNWTADYVEATGIGAPPERFYGKPQARPMALRAAQLDAYRNLLEVVNGVRVTSSTTVRDFSTESDEINAQVEGMVRGAQPVKRDYLSDGTVEVTLRMPLTGPFTQVLLPREVKQLSEEPPAPPAPAPASGSAPAAPEVFTGLVVDARGLSARPAMAPRILDEAGNEVYGSAFVSREFAVQQGMAGYSKDITAAQTNSRVTNNPATIKGIRTEGNGRADVVVSNADAAKLRAASENLSFLKKCRVMIVLD
ncbi:MAG: hypothetical protein AB1921_15510 [Thermodesulfobacteriota bacterium]